MKILVLVFFTPVFLILLACGQKKPDYTLLPESFDPSQTNSLIVNGNFSENRKITNVSTYNALSSSDQEKFKAQGYWHLIADQSARASVDLSEKMAHIIVRNSGNEWYSIQLAYLPLFLEKGKYYMAVFSARADNNREMVFEICQVGSWLSYSGRTSLILSKEWQTYYIPFTMKYSSEPFARFEFNIGGGRRTDVYVDHVLLIEAESN